MSNKYGDKYRVHNLVKFDYSQIGEYIDEFHTDRPLRNDELVDLLNEQDNKIQGCKLAKIIELEKELNEKSERIKELENELELYRHYVEFVPSSGDTE